MYHPCLTNHDPKEVAVVMSADDLLRRARQNAERSGGVPESAGELIGFEVGDDFSGRHRGREPNWGMGEYGVWLVWDDDGEPRFIWGCYRLNEEYEREQPAIGDRVVIHRGVNYKTRFDDEREASGLNYGLATEPCDEPLPDADGDDGIPFLCPAGSVTRSASPVVVGTAQA
jgi:hypothetical protein